MAHKSTETINEKKNENQINTEKCVKEDKKAQDTQGIRKKSKAKRKSFKNKVHSVQCLPSGSNTIDTQVYSTSPLLPTPYVSTMTTYYPQNLIQPIPIDWSPIVTTIQVPTPIYTIPFQPLPVIVNPVVTTICPYSCTVLTPPVITPVPIVTEIPAVTYAYEPTEVIYTDEVNDSITQVDETFYEQSDDYVVDYEDQTLESLAIEDTSYAIQDYEITSNEEVTEQQCKTNSIESYLSLPRNLFPAPRMLTLDPNPIIDVFCKLNNVHSHVPWLLDLEYGIPKIPIPRQTPMYNVSSNSIHCKNTPAAIHPGFDSCDEDFKRVFSFYYDCMVSSLYTGYVMFYCDTSVDNFQSWLLFPMQELGMCWL